MPGIEVLKMLVSIFCYLFCIYILFSLVLCEEYCYMKDDDPYTNFSAKTAYETVAGKGNDKISSSKIYL